MREVALGDLVASAREAVAIDDAAAYSTAGILSYGRGLFQRPIVRGDEVSYSKYYRIRAGQFIYSKLFAWEGALTVVNREFDGYFVSSEFPTFDVDVDLALPEFLRLITAWPAFWDRVSAGESGMGGRRKRVQPDRLLAVRIPLPPIEVQRRIADVIASVERCTAAVDVNIERCEEAAAALATNTLAWTGSLVPLGELVTIESRLVDPTDEPYRDWPHIGIDRIVARQGQLLPPQTASEDGVTSGKYLFTEDEVIYAKIRPELRKAVFPQFQGICSADAYPLRPGDRILPDYLLEVLVSEEFGRRSTARSGRTKMPKINRTELFAIRVPLPNKQVQADAAALLGAARSYRTSLTVHRDELDDLRLCLLADLLSGNHTIPDTYDALLEQAS